MQKIAVLMSTYNGEKFVREQIQSIIFQKISEKYILKLFVRDDGSTDTTPKIVDSIASQFEDKISVVKDKSGNLGVKKSFIKLVENIDADFYFFSDQDDIWLTDKVETMVNTLNKHPAYAAGVYSDLWIADSLGHSTGELMKGSSEVTQRVISQKNVVDYRQLLFTYIVTGASFAFNSKFKCKYLNNKSLDLFFNIKMHDSFFALLLASEKHLFYINEPLVLYRQHGGNLIGFNSKKNGKILKYATKWKSIIHNRKKIIQDVRIMITAFNINKDVQIELDNFITIMESNNIFKKWKLISKYEDYLMVKPKILEKIVYSFFIKL